MHGYVYACASMHASVTVYLVHAICDCLCKNRPTVVHTKNVMYVFGPCFSYTPEVSIHCVTCGQIQVVCCSEG